MANIILQASEKKSQSVYNNGDWDTKFDEPISIEQGDMVLIDKVFIDNTVANVDQMKIKDDLTLKIVSMIYTQDWLNDSGQTRFQIAADSVYPNGKQFILSEETVGPVAGIMLTNIMLEPIDRTKHWGGFTFNLKYYLPGTTTTSEGARRRGPASLRRRTGPSAQEPMPWFPEAVGRGVCIDEGRIPGRDFRRESPSNCTCAEY